MDIETAIHRVFLGTMVGDSLGLPAEGISAKRISNLGWSNWKQRFIFGKGMLSDDSEHTYMLAESLLQSSEDSTLFINLFARKLRWWLFGCPAGIGYATLKSIIKLCFGYKPQNSGVFSAGNGPAMRATVLGIYFHDNEFKRRDFNEKSTIITHTDSKCLVATTAITELAAYIYNNGKPSLTDLKKLLQFKNTDKEWSKIVTKLIDNLKADKSLEHFAEELECRNGVSGYIYQTVPIALYAVIRHYGEFEKTLTSVLNLGGDTDTAGAITGALSALTTSEQINKEWLNSIIEWPRTPQKYGELACSLAKLKQGYEVKQPFQITKLALPLRNLIFLLIVLFHCILRLLPNCLFKRVIS